MKRIIGYTLSAFLLLGAVQTSAQTAVWTGDYYVVVGMNEKLQYAVTYGYHEKWHEIKAGPDFQGGTFADLTLAPANALPNERLPGRYQLLAVGTRGKQAYAVTGYEWVNEPRFAEGMDPIANLTSATAVTQAGGQYFVLGRAMGGDGALPTPRDVVAYGRPGAWLVLTLPFDDTRTFTHLVASPVRQPGPTDAGNPAEAGGPSYPPFELLAVGHYADGSAFAMKGFIAGGEPRFSDVALPIPDIVRPVAVEWTGRDYIVVGDLGNGRYGMAYGEPGRWYRAKDFTLDGGKFTSLIASRPTEPRPTPAVAYDLLAVGTLETRAVSLPGTAVDGMPVFAEGCAVIPGLLGTGEGFVAAPPAAAGADGGSGLSAPAPNPFTRRAAFTVTVAEGQAVRVAVYDALGREVALLHDGALAAGAHAFALDGASLPSGTYFVRAQGARFAETRPVVLTR